MKKTQSKKKGTKKIDTFTVNASEFEAGMKKFYDDAAKVAGKKLDSGSDAGSVRVDEQGRPYFQVTLPPVMRTGLGTKSYPGALSDSTISLPDTRVDSSATHKHQCRCTMEIYECSENPCTNDRDCRVSNVDSSAARKELSNEGKLMKQFLDMEWQWNKGDDGKQRPINEPPAIAAKYARKELENAVGFNCASTDEHAAVQYVRIQAILLAEVQRLKEEKSKLESIVRNYLRVADSEKRQCEEGTVRMVQSNA